MGGSSLPNKDVVAGPGAHHSPPGVLIFRRRGLGGRYLGNDRPLEPIKQTCRRLLTACESASSRQLAGGFDDRHKPLREVVLIRMHSQLFRDQAIRGLNRWAASPCYLIPWVSLTRSPSSSLGLYLAADVQAIFNNPMQLKDRANISREKGLCATTQQ